MLCYDISMVCCCHFEVTGTVVCKPMLRPGFCRNVCVKHRGFRSISNNVNIDVDVQVNVKEAGSS